MSDRSWVTSSLSVLHRGACLLALARQGRLPVKASGHLRRASLRILSRHGCLEGDRGEDGVPQEIPSLRFWLRLLEEAGFLGEEEGHLRPSQAGLDWLERPLAHMLDALRQAWLRQFSATWGWMPADRRQRALDGHWRHLLLSALGCVARLSPGRWTAVRDVVAQLDKRRLLRPREVAQNLPQVRQAAEQRARNLLLFLFGTVLPALGLVETRGVGQSLSVRPTPEGADWLSALTAQRGVRIGDRVVPSHSLSFPCAVTPPLRVDERLVVTVHLTARPALTFEIVHLADLVAPGPPARYRVTRQSLQRAVAWGYDPANAILFLTTWHGDPLPERAVAQLESWRDDLCLIQVQPGYRLRAAGPQIRAAMRAREPVRTRTAPLSIRTDLWVGQPKAKALFRYLRRQGYALSLDQEDGGRARSWLPGSRSLPLSRLLVLLRTYGHLQPRIAGLPDLGLAPFERGIAAALSAEQMTAVDQLVGSNAALLDQHLLAVQGTDEPVLPEPSGVDESAAVERPAGSGILPHILAPQDGAKVRELVSGALEEGLSLELVYVDGWARVSRRVVHPLRLETYGARECLVAYCDLRQDERHFRLDRIVEARPLAPQEPEDLPPF